MVAQVEGSREALFFFTSGGDAAKAAEVWKRVETQVLDAMDLKGVADESKSHV